MAVKRATPAMNSRRRPRMSPARAPSSSRPPKVSAYAFCTHERPAEEKSRAEWMSGSAVMITEMSTMIIR
jgi:hypothetical protein